jgi:hypothetical protein
MSGKKVVPFVLHSGDGRQRGIEKWVAKKLSDLDG